MSLLLHHRALTMRMSSPTPDHRSIASEWQTTSLLVPKESRESDGAGLRRPCGDTLTNAVSTPTTLCTRGTHGGQENSYLFPPASAAHRNCPASLAGWNARYFAGVPRIKTGGEFTPCSTVLFSFPRHELLDQVWQMVGKF